ncbi:hypothetical protein ACHAXT_003522 [Thalassiosira profunda]
MTFNRRPTALAILAAALSIVLCTSRAHFPFAAAASAQENFLRATGLLKFQPDQYQGAKRRKRYFEGWYYKFVAPLDGNNNATDTCCSNVNEGEGDSCKESESSSETSLAVVPGIFHGQTKHSNESHAFVFVTNGVRQHYYRFAMDEFSYASGKEEHFIQVGSNRFTHAGVSLDLRPREGDDADLILKGHLDFGSLAPWPISLGKLGAMGPEAAVISFDNGRGYTEKDFGRSFPSLWIWLQTNSFRSTPGTSLFVSVARIPLFGMEFPGFTAAVWHDGTLIPFATWSGARFEELRVSDEELYLSLRSGRRKGKLTYRMEIAVDRRNVPEALLYAPVNFTRMAPFVKEALQAKVHLRLIHGAGDVIVDDVGEYAGLEVHGNVQWLVENVCGKETASKVLCL